MKAGGGKVAKVKGARVGRVGRVAGVSAPALGGAKVKAEAGGNVCGGRVGSE